MSAGRAAAPPPALDGFEYRRLIGTGGYSDVFLYEQSRPRREVAVKVLLDKGLTEAARRQFTAEADLMAKVSAHPYIVNIFGADVSDDGRPYLVMEYYSRQNLSDRARAEPLSVLAALRVGIQVAGAVETAHRLGILHRDIKPANILTSDYGRPGLTDFGISASKSEQVEDDEGGMSIPWSPPEMFRPTTEADERCDVYSLGATVWHLLVGHSPFEVMGGDNRPLALMTRIERDPIPSTGRADVPASLERVLQQAMGKRADGRFASAFDFARALQSVEQELQLALTPIEIPNTDEAESQLRVDVRSEGEQTRYRPTTVEAQTAPAVKPSINVTVAPPEPTSPGVRPNLERTTVRPAPVSVDELPRLLSQPKPARQRIGMPDELPLARTVGRPRSVPKQDEEVESVGHANSSRATRIAIGVVLLLVIAVSAVVATMGGGDKPAARPSSAVRSAVPQDVAGRAFVPPVQGSSRRISPKSVAFSWTERSSEPGDFFLVTRTDKGVGPQPVEAKQTTTTYNLVGTAPGALPCVSVVAVRANGQASAPTSICAIN
jgi:serine/threonine protein kinase